MNTPQLKVLLEALQTNANADWSQNDPAEEFKSLAEQLESIMNQKQTEKERILSNLPNYICDDDIEEAYEKLIAQSAIDGTVQADDIILIWEPLEFKYTVDQLLEIC